MSVVAVASGRSDQLHFHEFPDRAAACAFGRNWTAKGVGRLVYVVLETAKQPAAAERSPRALVGSVWMRRRRELRAPQCITSTED